MSYFGCTAQVRDDEVAKYFSGKAGVRDILRDMGYGMKLIVGK